jgi:hypothetical protein
MDFSVIDLMVVLACGAGLYWMFSPEHRAELDDDGDGFLDKNGRIPGDW